MPISKDEFESGKTSVTISNEDLLKKLDAGMAYSTGEIRDMLGVGNQAALSRLKRLEALGVIQRRKVQKSMYWHVVSTEIPKRTKAPTAASTEEE